MTETPLSSAGPRAGRRTEADTSSPTKARRAHRSTIETLTGRKGVLAATALPAPPTLEEKYGYLGRQHRWLLLVQTLALGLVVASLARFALSRATLWFFLAPATLYIFTSAISLWSSTRKRRINRIEHELLVMAWEPDVYPSVDVFLPTAGEPLEVLENTYKYVSRLEWPGEVKVYVLDDAARDEVREAAESRGFVYGVRANRGHLKKAGNLKFGFDQSDGDFIAIFDADFVPRPEYLHELMPYFDEPSTAIVQSPQYFDARPGMRWLQRCAGATQELFYRWIQPSRDRSKAAICVGTCAVYRRAALVEAGGFAQIGHSEDVHTGVNLMKVGYLLRYVPVVVSKGLCPDTLLGFLNQQYRWCTGSMSLLADRSFHANKLFSIRQRICFWSGFLYYISTAINIFVAPLPGLVMLWVFPQHIYPKNTVWLLGAIALWYFILPTVMRGYWRLDVLRVQQLYSFAHAVAIVHLLTGRTKELGGDRIGQHPHHASGGHHHPGDADHRRHHPGPHLGRAHHRHPLDRHRADLGDALLRPARRLRADPDAFPAHRGKGRPTPGSGPERRQLAAPVGRQGGARVRRRAGHPGAGSGGAGSEPGLSRMVDLTGVRR